MVLFSASSHVNCIFLKRIIKCKFELFGPYGKWNKFLWELNKNTDFTKCFYDSCAIEALITSSIVSQSNVQSICIGSYIHACMYGGKNNTDINLIILIVITNSAHQAITSFSWFATFDLYFVWKIMFTHSFILYVKVFTSSLQTYIYTKYEHTSHYQLHVNILSIILYFQQVVYCTYEDIEQVPHKKEKKIMPPCV